MSVWLRDIVRRLRLLDLLRNKLLLWITFRWRCRLLQNLLGDDGSLRLWGRLLWLFRHSLRLLDVMGNWNVRLCSRLLRLLLQRLWNLFLLTMLNSWRVIPSGWLMWLFLLRLWTLFLLVMLKSWSLSPSGRLMRLFLLR